MAVVPEAGVTAGAESMQLDGSAKDKAVSTHGPRNSGRELWRKSKGLAPRKKKGTKVNKQGIIASTKRAGRPSRRR
ncbi:hypothetical protein EXIGLDRAFT_715966 [Exidia glandulosa HHB12029]|uniref:Uncharacterized protein n=1 Tax=Exidia glandulosa HHB12029 TaxID=1314781 RepID=A0A165QQK5_EXIGL|nr:hypothetical protein EXIGLDRAFT_715966 [Exidia glandulosa HHB12029]